MSRLCTLTVAASGSGADIIGAAHTLYHCFAQLQTESKLYELRRIREQFARLRDAMPIVDDLIDELEGRKPPVKIDEQVAA